MDTFKDKQGLDELYSKGRAPWEVWRKDVQAADGVAGMRPLSPITADAVPEAKPGVRYNGDDSFLSSVSPRPTEIAASR
jgi:hypothetical protein